MDFKTKIQAFSPIIKQEILSWDEFKDKNIEGYEKILKYVNLDDLDYYFKYIHYEGEYRPGNKKGYFSYVLQENGEVKSFLECCITDRKNLHIATLFSHPLNQHEGFGTKLVKGILKEPKKFIGIKPKFLSGLVEISNFACHKFFQQFGLMIF